MNTRLDIQSPSHRNTRQPSTPPHRFNQPASRNARSRSDSTLYDNRRDADSIVEEIKTKLKASGRVAAWKHELKQLLKKNNSFRSEVRALVRDVALAQPSKKEYVRSDDASIEEGEWMLEVRNENFLSPDDEDKIMSVFLNSQDAFATIARQAVLTAETELYSDVLKWLARPASFMLQEETALLYTLAESGINAQLKETLYATLDQLKPVLKTAVSLPQQWFVGKQVALISGISAEVSVVIVRNVLSMHELVVSAPSSMSSQNVATINIVDYQSWRDYSYTIGEEVYIRHQGKFHRGLVRNTHPQLTIILRNDQQVLVRFDDDIVFPFRSYCPIVPNLNLGAANHQLKLIASSDTPSRDALLHLLKHESHPDASLAQRYPAVFSRFGNAVKLKAHVSDLVASIFAPQI